MKDLLLLSVSLFFSISSLSAQDKFDKFVNQMNRLEQTVQRLEQTGKSLRALFPVKEICNWKSKSKGKASAQKSFVTARKTLVITEPDNPNKIIALQWINLRIEAYSNFLYVYALNRKTGLWKMKQYIPREKSGTYRFSKTWIHHETLPNTMVSHTIEITVLGTRENAGVYVKINEQTQESFSL